MNPNEDGRNRVEFLGFRPDKTSIHRAVEVEGENDRVDFYELFPGDLVLRTSRRVHDALSEFAQIAAIRAGEKALVEINRCKVTPSQEGWVKLDLRGPIDRLFSDGSPGIFQLNA